MGRLTEKLARLRTDGESALVSYLMVGYPSYEVSLKAFYAVLSSGTDILEIGFPFSDPVADGPTIQQAHETALRNGITSRHVFQMAELMRRDFPNVPFLLMTYYNPIFRIGHEKFCTLAKESGIDGFLVPDLPPEECEPLRGTMHKHGLSLVLLASPTSTEERLKLICGKTDDMVYYVSVTGTTGTRGELPLETLKRRLALYRSLCAKPVVVGFGVSRAEQVREISRLADGVVVGSLLVRLAGERRIEDLSDTVKKFKEATIINRTGG